MSKHEKKRVSPWLAALIAALSLAVLLGTAVGVMAFKWKNADRYNRESMFVADEKTVLYIPSPSPAQESGQMPEADAAPTVSYRGKYYVRNENVVAVLFMGVDIPSKKLHNTGVQTGTHQADTLIVGAFDTANGSIRLINIPRDSMVDIYKLDAMYRYAYTERGQIATQYSFGDGGAISSTYTMDAVSRLLMGVPLYRYVTMSLSGIERATDLVGGIALQLDEDFTDYDRHMKEGATLTLNGKQATVYCRQRDTSVGDSNLSRMRRQMRFCDAFLSVLKDKVKENPAFLITFYNEMNEEMITNLTFDEVMLLAKQGLRFTFSEDTLVTVPGEMVEREYIVDDEALQGIVIDTFYTPAD
jgi:LCP family protein required for cell wall assembly